MMAVMKTLIQAMNVELKDGGAPEWVQLLPAGPRVQGRDGRAWSFCSEDSQAVCDHFRLNGADLPIDWEHATELKGPKGEEAPASGWIKSLVDLHADGALWGKVEWTPRARKQIEDKEYRFLSPVFLHTKEGRIRALDSVGLTNKPNLRLTSLNRQASNMEENTMKKALCRLLGLLETASDQEIQNAVSKLKGDLNTASNRAMTKELLTELGLEENAQPDQILAQVKTLGGDNKALNNIQGIGTTFDLTKYVPRKDYDLALNRAETAETGLKDRDEKELGGNIETAVNAAITGGKIAPASKDFYLSMCRKEGGLEEFKKFAESAPQVIDDPQLPDEPNSDKKALNQQQSHIADQFGNTAEDLAKYAGKGV